MIKYLGEPSLHQASLKLLLKPQGCTVGANAHLASDVGPLQANPYHLPQGSTFMAGVTTPFPPEDKGRVYLGDQELYCGPGTTQEPGVQVTGLSAASLEEGEPENGEDWVVAGGLQAWEPGALFRATLFIPS